MFVFISAAALSSAAVAGNVAVAGTNLNSLLNIGGGTKDMASVSTDPKSSRINASTSCGDIRTNNNNSGKGASNNSCRRSRAIPNKILSCNLSHSTASGAPIGKKDHTQIAFCQVLVDIKQSF